MKTFGVKRKLAIAFLTATCALTAAFGAGGFFGFEKASATADYTNDGFIKTGSLFTGSTINKSTLTALYDGLSPEKLGDFRGVEAALDTNDGHVTARKLREYNQNKDLIVTVQDKEWTVTYLSRDKDGNVIATLWLNDAGHKLEISNAYAPYSGGYTGGLSTAYPSNYYGSAFIRALLIGGVYSHGGAASVYNGAVNYTASTNPSTSVVSATTTWITFGQSYADYIVKPENVSWQIAPKDGYSQSKRWGNAVDHANDFLDTSRCKFNEGLDYSGKGSTSNKTNYTAWGSDLLWLPSFDETGGVNPSGTTLAGLWGTSLQQNQNDGGVNSGNLDPSKVNGTYNGTWLRSAAVAGAHPVYLNADGTFGSGYSYVCRMIRPAFHLNLTKLYEETKSAPSTENEDLVSAWNEAIETSLTNDGAPVTFTLAHDWTARPDEEYSTAFGRGDNFFNGGLLVPRGANIKLDLNGCILDRGLTDLPAINYGRVISVDGGTLEICDSGVGGKITGANLTHVGANDFPSCGGGIFADNAARITISGGSISGNIAGRGAGLYVQNDCFLKITGGAITNNRSTIGSGGGMSVYYGSMLIMTGGLVSDNVSRQDGGGIFVYSGGSAIIGGGVIRNNISNGNGGGLCARSNDARLTSITVNGGSILDNTTGNCGGGICGQVDKNGIKVAVTLNGGYIQGNYAPNAGGGVYVLGAAAVLDINGGHIVRNSAKYYGGGVYSECHLQMRGGEISYNKITVVTTALVDGYLYSGGGIYVRGEFASFTMYGGKVSHNESSKNLTYIFGGGIAVSSAKFTMYGGEVSYNYAYRAGGGIYLDGITKAVIYDGFITKNSVTQDGGGAICAFGNDASGRVDLTINGGTFSENVAYFCGGVYSYNYAYINLNGGRIINNVSTGDNLRAAGLHLARGGTAIDMKLTITGGIVVGNFCVDGIICNVSTGHNAALSIPITIGGKLASDTCIGLSGWTNGAAITSGFVTSGNALASYSTHFFADKGSLATAGNEVVWRSGGTISIQENLTWTVSDGVSSQSYKDTAYFNKEYSPAKNYTLSCSTNIYYICDETGRNVTTINKVGKYYAMSYNSASYANGNIVFEVLPLSLDGAEVSVANGVYGGGGIKPKTTVKLGGKTLTEGVDYTLEYFNNVRAGSGASVCIVGKGNYSGTVNASFEIESKNVNVRWGDLTKMYTGDTQSVSAVLEGVVAGDNAGVVVSYTDAEGNFVARPVDAGEYYAYAKLYAANDYKFADGAAYYKLFTIAAKPVDLKLEESSAEYTGGAQSAKAYYLDINGEKHYENRLTMTGQNGGVAAAGDADVYEVKITASGSADGNYAYTAVTRTLYYTITKAPVTASWEEKTYSYNGSVIKPQLVLDGGDGEIVYKYYTGGGVREEERDLIPAIINAGSYVVRAYLNSNNYALSDGSGVVEYLQTTVTVEKAVFSPENFALTLEREYTGGGLSAESSSNPLESNFKVAYYTGGALLAGLPVDAGDYAIKITDNNGNYKDYAGTFTVTPKTVAVEWSGDEYSCLENGVYKWLYDGKTHLPQAKAEGVEISVTGGKTDVGAGLAKAVAVSGNFVLTNAEAAFEVLRSTVVSVVWREYNGTAVEEGKTPNYQWISVYGENGPGLAAGGVLVRYDGGSFTSELQSVIALKVSYATGGIVAPENLNGYWFENYEGTELKLITAKADNPTIPANCVLGGDVGGRTQDFTVSALLVQTDKKYDEIVWVVENEVGGVISHETVKSCTVDGDGNVTVTENAPKFVYSGEVIAPVAIVILDKSYDPAAPKAGTYKVLTVKGGQVGVGEYSAFISADNPYSVRTEMLLCAFTVSPLEIESIVWTGKDGTSAETEGNFAWDYDGLAHAPLAEGVAADGTKCPVTVVGAVNAGNYIARVTADGNYILSADVENATHAYTINKTDISDCVVWSAAGGTAVNGDDGKFSHYEYVFDGVTKFAPAASFSVEINGETVTGALAVAGATAKDGMHYAYAYIPSGGDPVYANFSLDLSKAAQKFAVVRPNPVTVRWAVGENSAEVTGKLNFTYDGKPHTPYAYFIDDDGVKIALNVLGSGTDAGVYRAVVHDPRYAFAEGAEKEFSVLPQALRVVVEKDEFVYDGTAKSPVISFASADGGLARMEIDYFITEATEAGVHLAVITLADKNYALDGYEIEFTVLKQVIKIVWGDGVAFGYDGKAHAPEIKGGVMDNTAVDASHSGVGGYEITVVGAESGVGSYFAYAVIDNGNYKLENASVAFEIKPYEITEVEWTGADDGSFTWVYAAGVQRVPAAKFTDWKGDEVVLEVTGGAVNAGEDYEAAAVAPVNCAFAEGVGVRKFTVLPQTVSNLVWYYNGEVAPEGGLETDFDGTVPALSVSADGMDEGAIVVTGVGSDAGVYTAKAEPKNSGNIALEGGDEYVVTIKPKAVNIIWTAGEGAAVNGGTYTWNYDGKAHGVTASFEDITGATVEVPVSGGSVINVGNYTAKAVNVLGNYAFSELSDSVNIEILPQAIEFEWIAEGGVAVDGEDGQFSHFEFTYDGKAHLPKVGVKNQAGVRLIYTVTDADGNPVTAINAGEYLVTVRTATPSSLAFADEDGVVDGGNVVSVAFRINKREVTVVWGVTTLVYDGGEQAPEAWFVDANNQSVKLAVTGAESEVGEGYTAVAEFINDGLGENYELKDATTAFEIERRYADKVEWDWENGKWVTVVTKPEPEPETQTE